MAKRDGISQTATAAVVFGVLLALAMCTGVVSGWW